MRLQDGKRRSPRPIARALVLALLIAGGAVSAQQRTRPAEAPRESFDEMYRKGQQANATIRTLTARFTETTTSPLLTRPLVEHGTLSVERPSRVIMRYDDPEPRVVLIDGDRMTVSWPARQLRSVSNISRAQGRIQKYFVNNTAAELRKEFDIDARDTSSRAGLREVVLVPKRKQIRETLTRLEIWIGPSSSLLEAMRMTFAGGDTKTMEFQDVVPNAPLAPGTFAEPR